MYYKVIKDDKIIDVLDRLIYLKWQDKHKIWILSGEEGAQAILSSDGNTVWHEQTLYDVPIEGYDTVSVKPIDEFEYKQLKILHCKSLDEVLDEYTLLLISEGVI